LPETLLPNSFRHLLIFYTALLMSLLVFPLSFLPVIFLDDLVSGRSVDGCFKSVYPDGSITSVMQAINALHRLSVLCECMAHGFSEEMPRIPERPNIRI